MRHLSSTVVLVFMTAFSSQLEAGTWRVELDGSGDAPFIQAAIDSSSHGDLVLVGPGTYFEHLNFKGKNIWLKSFAGAEVTILDGNWQAGSVIQLVSGETNDAIVDGFTVTHGYWCTHQRGGSDAYWWRVVRGRLLAHSQELSVH